MPMIKVEDVDFCIIHCSASTNGGKWTAKDVDTWHGEILPSGHPKFLRDKAMRESLWPDGLQHIAYHRVIETDGTITAGRFLDEQGAHCRASGMNPRSWGICLMGDDKFTEEQWWSLRAQILDFKVLRPLLGVGGHYQWEDNKTCPNFSVPKWLDGGMVPLAGHIC